MSTLESLQSRFLQRLVARSDSPFHAGDDETADRGWAVYRRNYHEAHAGALADTYDSVLSLVGPAYFRALARRFVDEHPSRSGDLNDYGTGFPEFLDRCLPSFPGGDDLPYLPDVARLDRAWLVVLRAAVVPGPGLEALASRPAERWPETRIRTQPACRLVRSAYPLYRIWRAAQGDAVTVALDAGGEAVLVSRPDEVRVTLLSAAEAAFASVWMTGATLERALEAALGLDPAFDLTDALRRLSPLNFIASLE